MAVRAATAAAAKTKPKTRSGAKASSRVKKPAAAPEMVDGVAVKAPVKRRKPKTESRTRIYWAVFNQSLKRVAVFEFDQKVEAEKRAAKLTSSSGEDHFIQKLKAVVQEPAE